MGRMSQPPSTALATSSRAWLRNSRPCGARSLATREAKTTKGGCRLWQPFLLSSLPTFRFSQADHVESNSKYRYCKHLAAPRLCGSSETDARNPEKQENVSQQKANASQQRAFVSQQKANVSQQSAFVSQQKANVSQQRAFVSQQR